MTRTTMNESEEASHSRWQQVEICKLVRVVFTVVGKDDLFKQTV